MTTVTIREYATAFAEDKDVAARIRNEVIRPALERNEAVRLDFTGVDGATQSFIHAMVSDLIRTRGAAVLKKIEFRACNPTIRAVVEIVVEYSQLEEPPVSGEAGPPNPRMQPTRPRRRGRTGGGNSGKRRVSDSPRRRAGR